MLLSQECERLQKQVAELEAEIAEARAQAERSNRDGWTELPTPEPQLP